MIENDLFPRNQLIPQRTLETNQCLKNDRFPRKMNGPLTRTHPYFENGSNNPMHSDRIEKWPALKTFSYEFFADLYDSTAGAYQSVEDECQFLPFKTNFLSLQQAFHMNTERAKLRSGQPWYIGWYRLLIDHFCYTSFAKQHSFSFSSLFIRSNCHPKVRQVLRSYYQHPEFLPADSESSALDWIFMGAPGPATTTHVYPPFSSPALSI